MAKDVPLHWRKSSAKLRTAISVDLSKYRAGRDRTHFFCYWIECPYAVQWVSETEQFWYW